MKSSRVLLGISILMTMCLAAWGQNTGSITGTVKDPSGAAIAGAQVVVTDPGRGITREMNTNSTGDYNQSALPPGTYDVIVTATGFKKYQAKAVKLDVAEKARVDVTMQVGATTTEVVVQGENVAQVETQSSELAGTVTGKEITQLELNGRNFSTLVQLVPGVSNQTGLDEPQVGVAGNVSFSMNGGRTEYNNWELDGGDNMDNGSNSTLNVYPSVDAISEFKVLTSNYGAQYGRNGSGTVEVETKSGTRAFHGDAYEFVRNDAFNALNYTDMASHGGNGKPAPYKKNDYGYTIGGPVYIPGVYNKDKEKTFFFWSQEWRRDRVTSGFNTVVPYSAERTGDFSDLCLPAPTADCPTDPRTGAPWDGTHGPLPIAPAATALLPLIPVGTVDVPGASAYVANIPTPTNWREELFRIDHNVNSKNRLTFRYIHDSWNYIEPTPIWSSANFPTTQTFFNGPGISMVARLTSNISPTLLNEFVASYTADHILFKSQGVFQRPASLSSQMGTIFNNGFGGKLPAISMSGGIYDGVAQDPDGVWPEGLYNSNPTYTYRDNITKIVGRHNLQFGAYLVTAQKNELSSLQVNGALTFDTGSKVSSGNAFADMLLGNIGSYSQGSNQVKFYNRYKIFEPYFQDDWRVTDRLTVNLGLRVSLMGTYRERYHHAYNWDPAVYNPANAPQLDDAQGTLTGAAGALVPGVGNPFDGLVVCGAQGGPVSVPGFPGAAVGSDPKPGCMNGHLFNPAPRIGFAWDPRGNGRTAIRGGYGVFFEHANGNEANTEGMEGQTSPLLQTETQNNIPGYLNIGNTALTGLAPTFPASFLSIPNQVVWPYMQQWHLDVQHELPGHTVMTVSYVGSKGTHLGRQRDLNQLFPVAPGQNPYVAGEPITDQITYPDGTSASPDCGAPNGAGSFNQDAFGVPTNAVTSAGAPVPYGGLGVMSPAVNLGVAACGVIADYFRPFHGVSTITRLENKASSTYHALQVSVRRSVGALSLSAAYTYSHSIDDSSDRYDGAFVNSYDVASSRASSSFDQRHILNVGYVYDLPFFKKPGALHTALGGWEYSGIFGFSTGTPFTVNNGTTFGDNAGVGNAVGTGSYADVIGNPKANIPPASQVTLSSDAFFFYNPGAFAVPTGLTFGDAGRNSLRNPNRTNFDMALFKHFAIKESMAFEFRAEAFNIFNHSEWVGTSTPPTTGSINGGFGTNGFLEIGGAHLARILQFGAKFIF